MDKPLHVQVAEALGFFCVQHEDKSWWTEAGNTPVHIPHYDSDWSATGPLIERFHIMLTRSHLDRCWAFTREGRPVTGDSPLIAVCNLILALHKAGKL